MLRIRLILTLCCSFISIAALQAQPLYVGEFNIRNDHAKDAAIVQTPDEYLSYQPSITVECQACGGKSKVAVGQTGVCEYCGSPIFGAWASAED